MKTTRWPGRCLAGLALALALTALGGCQTWVAGMTLPSPRYLDHSPQYIPPSPPFPLPRELASQELAASSAAPGALPPAVPVPVPAGPPPGPAPLPPPP